MSTHIHLDPAENPHANVTLLALQGPRALGETMVNHVLNDLIANHSKTDFPPIPFQGWFWRSVDFFGTITIADGAGQVAICENNKWGYPERTLTDQERDKFRDLVWDAYRESRRGGRLDQIRQATRAALDVAGEHIEALTVPGEW